jgi:hypothetical protein
MFVLIYLPLTAVHGQEKVQNPYFSMKIPNTWTYVEFSNTGIADLYGRGPGNTVILAPSDFSNFLLQNKEGDTTTTDQKMQEGGGAYSAFAQDTDYNIKNSPLEAYVKYRIDQQSDNWNVSSMDNGTIGKQKAVKISANGTNESADLRKVEYLVLHNKDPYLIQYMANVKDFDKYLPEFEQMVRSFKFVG